ncbi:MAG: DUF1573 domain-containing protein [Chitinophagaceae bacterium]|nr:DUF1573 domain-containing protein [Chitinophagaceae bacterium]
MKNIYLYLTAFLFIGLMSSCYDRSGKTGLSGDAVPPMGDVKTTVEVIDTLFNFGRVAEGEKVVYNFRFKNTGNQPLVITSATASCGCTVPERPEGPIAPGETAHIKVVFDSKGRVGPAHKEIYITSNAEPEFPELVIAGEVAAASN